MAIDPSFSSSGVCFLDWSARLLLLDRIKKDKPMTERTFGNILNTTLEITTKLNSKIDDTTKLLLNYNSIHNTDKKLNSQRDTVILGESNEGDTNFLVTKRKSESGQNTGNSLTHVITEVPPHASFFSAGLYCLDSVLCTDLMKRDSLQQLWMINPNFIPSLHGKRGYKKSESLILAGQIVDMLVSKWGFVYLAEKKMNDDEAEALLLMILLVSKRHGEIVGDLCGINERFCGCGNDMLLERSSDLSWQYSKTQKRDLLKKKKA